MDQKKILMLQGKFADEGDEDGEGIAYQLLTND